MPPALALLLCFVCIVIAYRIDAKRAPNVSYGLWIPLIWVLILGSRPVSLWFNRGGLYQSAEGSPVDATIYLLLILAAGIVLWKRQIRWHDLFARNRFLVLLLLFMAVSVLWTDVPFTSFKRFIKMIGMPAMGLVVLTEHDPVVAVKTLARRSAYVLIPLSETLNKYFFSFAVRFDDWTGAMMFSGAAESKNMLGQMCFIEGLLLIWILRQKGEQEPAHLKRTQFMLDSFILALAVYLLLKSHSSTSLVCFMVGAAVLLGGNLRFVRWRIATWLTVPLVIFTALELTVGGIFSSFTAALGRNPTLTNRTDIWRELWALRENSLVGTGFEGFWTGARLLTIMDLRQINEAHNGYLEAFLNLGAIGLMLWILLIVRTYKNCRNLIVSNYNLGRIGMTLFSVFLIYNLAESGIKGLSFVLFFFFLIAIDVDARDQSELVEEAEVRFGDTRRPSMEAASVR
jgi:exopolysaccharide production protein ExoQ